MIMEQKCANCGNGKWRDGVTEITSTCIECKYVDKEGEPQPSNWIPKVKTNADRIRAMSDRELADFLSGKFNEVFCLGHSLSVIQREALKHNLFCIFMKWLKQPVEDEQ
jgi:hypothetical protein